MATTAEYRGDIQTFFDGTTFETVKPMVFSGLYSPVINPKICSKLKGSLNYIPSVPDISKNAVSNPEVRVNFSCFFYK